MLPLSEKELDELVAQERERGSPPLTSWDSIAAQLRAEGLIKETRLGGFASRALSLNRSTAQPLNRGLMQAAAAVLLVAGGTAIGRYTANTATAPAATIQTAQTPSPVENVSATNASAPIVPQFKSADDAWATLNRAGEEYQRASAYLSASNTDVPMPTNPDTYRTRLAALDNVMTEVRQALREAPHDPVINQYYQATVGAREATLRQLGTTLPAGARLNRF